MSYNAANGYTKFYINGYLVATGTLTTYKSGNVGVEFYRDTSAGNPFYTDWATLTTTASDQADEEVGPDVIHIGDDTDVAPQAARGSDSRHMHR